MCSREQLNWSALKLEVDYRLGQNQKLQNAAMELWMSKEKAMGLMFANNNVCVVVYIILLENRVSRINKLLLSNSHVNSIQSLDILNQRCLLHRRQLIIY